MSGRPVDDPGRTGQDRPFLYPSPGPVPRAPPMSPQSHVPESNVESQGHRAALENAFAAVNLHSPAAPYRSPASYSASHPSRGSRSPEEEGAPPFQYRSQLRPNRHHLASPLSSPSPNSPLNASYTQEGQSSIPSPQQRIPQQFSPPIQIQGSLVDSQSKTWVASPRPFRPQRLEGNDPNQIAHPRFQSANTPFGLPYGQGPSADSIQTYSSPRPNQTPRANPLALKAAEPYNSPQLVPPHQPGGYNPLENPHVPKLRSSSPKPAAKKGFWKKALRKFSDHQDSSQHTPRAPSPAGRYKSETPPSFPRPRAPTPSRERIVFPPRPNLSSPGPSERYYSEETAPPNTPTKPKILFSVTEEGAIIFNREPGGGDSEAEAIRLNLIRPNRSLDSPSFVLEGPVGQVAPRRQNQTGFQELAVTPVSQPVNPRRRPPVTLEDPTEGLGIYQDPSRPFSWQSQISPAPFVPARARVTPQETRTFRDHIDQYHSQAPGYASSRREGRVVQELGEWVEAPVSTFQNSEFVPGPSEVPRAYREPAGSIPRKPKPNQEQFSRPSPAEFDLNKSYPEPIVSVRSPQDQVRGDNQAFASPFRQLEPDTPKSEGYRQAHWALTGARPTDSVCQLWDSRKDKHVAEESGNFESGRNVDDPRSPSPTRYPRERFPSRGRQPVRESQLVQDEDIPREEESSVLKRRFLQTRRKAARDRRLAGNRALVDYQRSPEGVVDKFPVGQSAVNISQRLASYPPIGPERRLSQEKRRLERRRRSPAGSSEAGPSVRKRYLDLDPVQESNRQIEQGGAGGPSRVGGGFEQSEEAEEYPFTSLGSASPIPKGPVDRLKYRAQPSSHFQEGDILVCVRSKTGTVKELPVTPENKATIKSVLQQNADYTPSLYSSDYKQSALVPAAEVCVSPLNFRKTPTPPRSNLFSTEVPSNENVDPFRTTNAFLDSCLSASEDRHQPTMDSLQVSSALRSSTKTKAEEDARAMQKSVIDSCKKAGRDPPKYVLMELIGKGSFGRVYKGKDINTTQIVAVKIIDIDESDTLNPRLADTYSEFMKEINALKILSESKAKNINHVIEALPVGTAMWMIIEYCGGGSVATLMKPTPDGLKEKFIIPILREVAEAVKWVHQAGIIHRDLKCANILITENGGVQLCDFGVAGITETALDKRSTFIGTFHWMAPELFRGSAYGKEVDIWAFGCMTYEMATGLPPNAMSGVTGMDLGTYLKTHIPRLEGDNYSEGLKSIVAYCLEENPGDRPPIEAVQRHGYIHNSSARYPSSGLSDLVKAFKLWESHGGMRRSLFAIGGAQGPSELSSTAMSDDNWNFSTTPAFDQAVAQASNPQDIINVYGASVTLSTDFADETSRPIQQQQAARPSRRRPPPEALAPLKAPLEKLFDPNTMSNYRDNSIQHFNLQPNTESDLPLRDDSALVSIRDTLIDLDAHDIPSGLSSFSDMDTVKPARRAAQDEYEEDYESGPDFNRPALSDPADNPNRRTRDWKFPAMAPPASANPEFVRFPPLQRPHFTPASGARPALVHHPTEPASFPSQGSHSLAPPPPAPGSDRMSLIDLDMSIPEPSRPSTADSAASQDIASVNPFMWEEHASVYNAQDLRSAREPSLYVDDSAMGLAPRGGDSMQDSSEVSDFSASDAEGYPDGSDNAYRVRHDESSVANRAAWGGPSSSPASHSAATFHPLPAPPSAAVLSGTASSAELRSESQRMFETLRSSLETFRETYERMPTRPLKGNQNASGDDA